MPPAKTFVQKTEKHPFLLSVEDVASQLSTDLERGLTGAKVAELQRDYPKNELQDGGAVSWYTVLGKQVANAMILVLIFAMALSFGVKDYVEGGVLAAVILLNVTIGFFQEFGAEKKMEALRQLSAPSANVLRDGKIHVVPSSEVVPGDIVILKTGDTVPADLRLFEAMNLNCDEKSLTGESEPVEKITENGLKLPESPEQVATTEEDLGIGDRVNMAYSTTTVTKGRGRGIVVFTGMATEVGKIAASTNRKAPPKEGRSMNAKKYGLAQPFKGLARRTYDVVGKFLGLTVGTPLQRKLSKLAYILFGCAILLAIIVFGVNRFNVTNEVAIYAISTGIAIIPESLVAVLTITMVVGMTVMRKANVVIRDLSALEALGGVTNICSDKTGTLTQGAMIMKKAWLWKNGMYTVVDSTDPSDPSQGKVTRGPSPSLDQPDVEENKPDFDYERSAAALTFDVPAEKLAKDKEKTQSKAVEEDAELTKPLEELLQPIALCNLATVRREKIDGVDTWQTTGEPTEIALQVFAHRFESGKKVLVNRGWKQVGEFSFDSTVKRMSVAYNPPESTNSVIFTKGAVERILDLCTHIGSTTEREPLTEAVREHVIGQMNALAGQGQRVLAIAYRNWDGNFEDRMQSHNAGKKSKENDQLLRDEVEQDLTLLGLVGIYDPPRIETKPSIRECTTAGIKVHMLTGDHPATATAIAKEIGIIPHNLGILAPEVADAIVQKATEFDAMTDAEIDALPALPLVIARCAPATKSRMIAALRRRQKYIAMTGDGVNDAPSLRHADVGIAMGLAGSDVAKSAAKLVLTDDKFNSIVAAIREGRKLFDNIQKFILHLLSSNVGEVILLIAGLGFQDESRFSVFPLSPLEILWINTLTSGFPAFGLGREPGAREVMRRKPHDIKAGVFTWEVLADMMVYGVLMGVCTLFTFIIIVYGFYNGNLGFDCNRSYSDSCIPVFRARAAVFVELIWIILLEAWELKNFRRSLFSLDPQYTFWQNIYVRNKFLFFAVVLGSLSVFPAIYIPGLNTSVFKHIGIGKEWGIAIGGTLVFLLGVEGWKAIKRAWGLFKDETEDAMEDLESKKLGLRQGFFTIAKKNTGSFSLRSLSRKGTERSIGRNDGGVQLSELERGRSRTRKDQDPAHAHEIGVSNVLT